MDVSHSAPIVWANGGDTSQVPSKTATTYDNGYPSLTVAEITKKYRFFKLIGTGGSGTVYRGKDRSTGKLCAIKFIKCGLTQSDRYRVAKAVQKEVDVTSMPGLRDQGVVVSLQQHYFCNNQFVLVMDLVKDIDMFHFRADTCGGLDMPQEMPLETLKTVTRNLLRAVDVLHSHGVAHRDLKPENVMIRRADLHVTLIDLGHAHEVNDSGRVPGDGSGTPGFRAPEANMRQPYDGRKADLFSIGAILTETIAREQIFGEDRKFRRRILKDVRDPLARDLLESLLRRPPYSYSRLTAAEALRHPWLRCNPSQAAPSSSIDASSGAISSSSAPPPTRTAVNQPEECDPRDKEGPNSGMSPPNTSSVSQRHVQPEARSGPSSGPSAAVDGHSAEHQRPMPEEGLYALARPRDSQAERDSVPEAASPRAASVFPAFIPIDPAATNDTDGSGTQGTRNDEQSSDNADTVKHNQPNHLARVEHSNRPRAVHSRVSGDPEAMTSRKRGFVIVDKSEQINIVVNRDEPPAQEQSSSSRPSKRGRINEGSAAGFSLESQSSLTAKQAMVAESVRQRDSRLLLQALDASGTPDGSASPGSGSQAPSLPRDGATSTGGSSSTLAAPAPQPKSWKKRMLDSLEAGGGGSASESTDDNRSPPAAKRKLTDGNEVPEVGDRGGSGTVGDGPVARSRGDGDRLRVDNGNNVGEARTESGRNSDDCHGGPAAKKRKT